MVKHIKEGNGVSAAVAAVAQANPEAQERKRLKRLAISNQLLLESPARRASPLSLSPSKTVCKHHGKDILKKCSRKNRFLFSFPGLLAPVSGGKVGELKDLGSKNPVLYLDFPQGQVKLFGTIVYPKNRYLTLQFSRAGKNVICEDYFDAMIVFSDAWWIGRKDENPQEIRLEFPEELNLGHQVEFDFKGGAGSTFEKEQGVGRNAEEVVQQESSDRELDYLSDSQNDLKDVIKTTPTRHSARTAGKTFKFAETSSEDESTEVDVEKVEKEEIEVAGGRSTGNHTSGKTEVCPEILNIDDDDAAACIKISKQLSKSAVLAKTFKDESSNNQASLVQATVSTLFKKVDKKRASGELWHSPQSKVSNNTLHGTDLEKKIDKEKEKASRKKGKVVSVRGTKNKSSRKQTEVEDDEIEELSSTSKDSDGSDEDWCV